MSSVLGPRTVPVFGSARKNLLDSEIPNPIYW
jgi:hypothetical protein